MIVNDPVQTPFVYVMKNRCKPNKIPLYIYRACIQIFRGLNVPPLQIGLVSVSISLAKYL